MLHRSSIRGHGIRRWRLAISGMGLVLAVLLVLALPQVRLLTFQTPIPTESTSHSHWIISANGGAQRDRVVKVVFPSWFTERSGADVYVDVIEPPLLIRHEKLIMGTQFALGIWPLVKLQKPIEIQVLLDAAQVSRVDPRRLVVMMYDPTANRWEELPSELHLDRSQITATVQEMKPIPPDAPSYGERTFFGVFEKPQPPTPTRVTEQQPTPTQTQTPTRTVAPTRVVRPTYTSRPTRTPSLAQAPTNTPRPTHTPSPSRLPTSTPKPTHTFSPTITPTLTSADQRQVSTPLIVLGTAITCVPIGMLLHRFWRRGRD